ncbi:cortactin-binding 2 [Pelobates cultripes]|uniref:Cortactin-binding protein 2 n=1 Tax=Pelobates cultripes TaxID=61616 RepID=A0AAD1VYE2_PELCU|nr:cortactin-binding 2 [Pelobates cultripes]
MLSTRMHHFIIRGGAIVSGVGTVERLEQFGLFLSIKHNIITCALDAKSTIAQHSQFRQDNPTFEKLDTRELFQKKDFNVENLSKPELRFLLSILEGELEARDLVIEALRARKKEVFVQERYGRFNLGDPFLALQRDFEASAFDKEKKPICNNPLTILEAVMAHCRKMQERMTAQLAAAERRQRKLEAEKLQLQNLEQEHKKLLARLEEERTKNKHVVLILVKECKLLSGKIAEEAQNLDEAMSKLEAEKKKGVELEEALAAEKQRLSQMEAQMGAQIEKQLSEFDTEREHLRAKFSREEVHTKELQDEIDRLKKTIEQLKLSKENESKANLPFLHKNKDRYPVSVGTGSRSVSCQTNLLLLDSDSEISKKSPLAIPTKPSVINHVIAGNTKINVCTNSAFVKPGSDRQNIHNESVSLPTTHGVSPSCTRTEENGSSSSDGTSNTLLYPNNSYCASPASPSYLSQSMQSLHTQCPNTPINSGLSPRIQAAKFKFQANANEHDQNGNTTQMSQIKALSPNPRENLAAKQMARNTVTQVLSRFTNPPGTAQLRPGYPHPMETGTYPPVAGRLGHPSHALKSTSVSRVDRGNPPPIPPKKPGLSQTPAASHPQLKAPPNVGGKIENKPITSAPSSTTHGIRVLHEESVSKSSSPQLPPKPSIEVPVAPADCVIPAIGTSQVGAWPPQSPGWKEPACSESSLVIPSTIACTSSIIPVSASSCRPCDSDSLLVTASGWCPSLTALLTSGGPVPLGDLTTHLHHAAAQGNVTLLSMLLNEEELDLNHLCKDGLSTLYFAAANGHSDCVKMLLTSGAHVDATVSNGFTALCTAAAQGHYKCAEILIAFNADINHVGGGQTPLYLACQNGNSEIVKLLLEAGADRSIVTKDGRTAIHATVEIGNVDCLKLLMYFGVSINGDRINSEESNGNINELNEKESLLLQKEKSIAFSSLLNASDREGWTAAHIAASKGFKNCLEILCNHFGFEPERRDNCNRTAHDVATDDCKQLLESINSLRIPVRISLEEHLQVCYSTIDYESQEICSIRIHRQTTWDDFSKAVSRAVMEHFATVMSDGWEIREDITLNNTGEFCIGFGAPCDLSFKLGNTSWSIGQIFLQAPWEFVKMSKVEYITVLIPGPKDGCLNGVAYASVIPIHILQNFLRLVEQYHNVIFQGPEGSFQEYIVQQLGHYMKQKEEAAGFSCDIVKIEVEPELTKEQLVDVFINSGSLISVSEPPSKKKIIVILEHLEKSSVSDLLGDLMAPLDNRGTETPYCVQRANGQSDSYYFHENCFFMGTVARARLQGSELPAQQYFRWVQLRWDGEPMQSVLPRFLKRKAVFKFKGKMPPPSDPVCKGIDWVNAVWYQLNSCLSRLGTPEALLGPQQFLSCPVVPGNAQIIVKWMSKLWNAVIVPKVQEAILFIASVKRSSTLGHITATKTPSQGQQAIVKAALSILLNKAVLHGCHLSTNDLEQYIADFKGGHAPMSMSSTYKPGGKKKVENGAWRKVSTSPRKKSSHLTSWSKPEEKQEERALSNVKKQGDITPQNRKRSFGNDRTRSLNSDQRLSVGSDDEVDLVKELQTMCSSKSEPDITKIADLDSCLVIFKNPTNDQISAIVNKPSSQKPNKDGVCPPHNIETSESGTSRQKQKPEPGVSKVKSLLPVPRTQTVRYNQQKKQH